MIRCRTSRTLPIALCHCADPRTVTAQHQRAEKHAIRCHASGHGWARWRRRRRDDSAGSRLDRGTVRRRGHSRECLATWAAAARLIDGWYRRWTATGLSHLGDMEGTGNCWADIGLRADGARGGAGDCYARGRRFSGRSGGNLSGSRREEEAAVYC
jgi:hypothetical protein